MYNIKILLINVLTLFIIFVKGYDTQCNTCMQNFNYRFTGTGLTELSHKAALVLKYAS